MSLITIDAHSITSTTLVGYLKDKFPIEHGNCFSMMATVSGKKKEFRIVNFAYENLKELLKRGLKYPIKIYPLEDSKVAIIHDDRIPDTWYDERYCEVCCPDKYLPTTQIRAHDRQESRGERTMQDADTDAGKMRIVVTDSRKHPDFRTQKEKDEIEKWRKSWKVEIGKLEAFHDARVEENFTKILTEHLKKPINEKFFNSI